jgi:RNA polymerase sigma-70 factor (ECF subfamily)
MMKDMPVASVATLLNRIAQGDDKAATELYRHYYGFVYAYLRYKMADEQAAEETAHDVFIAVCRRPLAFQGNSKFSTWLCGIANNKTTDWLRKKGRHVPVVDIDDEVLGAIPDPDADIVGQLAQAQNAEIVRRCVEGLPDKHREVVFLAYFEEASMEEIAERVACPEGTVKSRLSNARAKLLDCLKRWLGDHHD